MLETGTHKVIHFRTTSTYIKIGTFRKSTLIKYFIKPIYIRINIRIQSCNSTVNFFLWIRAYIASRTRYRFIKHFHIRGTVNHIGHTRHCRYSSFQPKINNRLIQILTVFSRNNHHSIGTTCTIQRRSSSIFQNRKTFNNLRIQRIQFRWTNFNPIHDNQSRSVTIEGRFTTDPKVSAISSRFTTALHRYHTGHTSCKSSTQTRRRYFKFLRLDLLNRSHKRFFLLPYTKCSNDYLSQFCCRLF